MPRPATADALRLVEQAAGGAFPVATRTLLDRLLRRPPRRRPLTVELTPALALVIEPAPDAVTLTFVGGSSPGFLTATATLPHEALRQFVDTGHRFLAFAVLAEVEAESDRRLEQHTLLSKLSRRPPDPLFN